jgi:chromosome segregation protein
VAQALVPELRTEQGTLILADLPAAAQPGREGQRAVDAALASGGGRLAESVRRDPGGAVSRLLATSVWVPSLEDALSVRPQLPVGWAAVTRDGEVVTAEGIVRLGGSSSLLERRAGIESSRRELETLVADLERAEGERTEAADAVASAREADQAAASAAEAGRRELRTAEDRERATARRLETHQRERGWQEAQLARLDGQAERLRSDLASLEPAAAPTGSSKAANRADTAGEHWEARIAELRRRREAAAREADAAGKGLREAEDRRRRAEMTLTMESARIEAIEPELGRLVEAESTASDGLQRLATEIASLREAESSARGAIEGLEGEDAEERGRLADMEKAAAAARERLRAAEERSRSAEVSELEARLAIDTVRESLLVELAGLGPVGLRALRVGEGITPESVAPEATVSESSDGSASEQEAASAEERLAEDLERALDEAIAAWASAAPETEPPTSGRLSSLRRRYHELGAANPFAAEEYEEVRERLESLEGQQTDLLEAIEATRRLIGELSTLVAERFRTTFAALEDAFGRRFEQLFDGGDAQLALTDPDDLSVTGVEIMARPPGKKRQPLQMLSGGERALTAVALLFAMLEVRPVPFCVLDEVDAALDEANVGRFVSALRGLAERTQFIVITHNRGTIESADALYGVTIGDDAVSRVVSMRIAEATAIAAERAVTGAAVGA